MTRLLIASSVITTFALAGCSTFWDDTLDVKQESQPPDTQGQKWWQVFQDPLMDDLAETLLQENIDLKIAMMRIDEARALGRMAGASLFPQITAGGKGSRGNTNIGLIRPETVIQGGFDTSWEMDIFGANRAARDASYARLEAAQATAQDVRRIVMADLIRAIIQWRQAQQTLIETKRLLSIQDDQVSLLQSRLDAGLMDATMLEQAKAQRQQTAMQIPVIDAKAKGAQHQIERLLGQEPNSLLKKINGFEAHNLTSPEPAHALDLPLDTVRIRPDIRAAHLKMIAAQKDLQEAESNLWPKISLSAFFGVQDTSKGLDPVTAPNPLWSLGGSMMAPLLNFGRLRSAVDGANARSKTAALTYEQTVLLALEESHTALSDYLNSVNALKHQLGAVKHKQEAANLARKRFNGGLTNMTALTAAEAELSQAIIALIDQKTTVAIAHVHLHKALGSQ